ncbi:MAG TPA: asparagine synthase-related protein [Pyrinomonadaceae bacterium]|jgi:asparagine synthase (glutamine-hydrolysing)|nr:asparagine synthase-related protein [Pyrinomonadaceae bacterium]
MPGIVGLTTGRWPLNTAQRALGKMQDLIAYTEPCRRDELFSDRILCATRATTDIIQKQPQPHSESGIYAWLDGEIYNREELAREAKLYAETDAALLVALYRQGDDFSFLKKIDGIYSAAIYDADRQKLHLISDRYGLRHLFWTIHEESIAWASEVKALLAVPDFDPKIDPVALNDFLRFGHMLGDRTWFEGVELLRAGTVLTWDERERSVSQHRYWWWDQIKPLTGKMNENELVEELGSLFIAAVQRRCPAHERVGLTLSGGLDSRAILAAMPQRGDAIHAATFGKAGCDDIRLAAAAARVKGAAHHVSEVNSDNWLMPRVEGVWHTDGHLNLMHMHIIAVASEISGLFDICLDGFLGDATIGGSYIGDPQFDEIRQIDNRGRRFIALGPKTLRAYVETRLPFFDNKFMELTISIPEALRKNSYLYRKMLLKSFPEFFRTIPWQKTGSPIRWPGPLEEITQLTLRGRDKLLRVMARFGLALDDRKTYTDYPQWIRQEPSRSFFKEVLGHGAALYPAYIPPEQVRSDLACHLNGEDRSESLCRILTFEIWLQQVFEGKYRPTLDARSTLAVMSAG